MNPKRIFLAGTARSGSYLICQMLSANPKVMAASDPFLLWFRSLRNAIIRASYDAELIESFDFDAPLGDHYFEPQRRKIMDLLDAATLDIPFDPAEWEYLHAASAKRAELQCAEVIPLLHRMKQPTYRGMFEAGLAIIADARRCGDRPWVGMKETWCVDFMPLLAREYPESRFIVVMRDPRGVINSMLNVEKKETIAQVLSYCRHWRKLVAYINRFESDPLFKNRFLLVRHEQVLADPEKRAREMSDFLEVPYHPDMIDTQKYFDYGTGKTWLGNSAFEKATLGISTHRIARWRKTLRPEVVAAIEFLAGPDMASMGYELTLDPASQPTREALDWILNDTAKTLNWRSDFRLAEKDIGYELLRHRMLELPETAWPRDLIRRVFLYEDCFERLKARQSARASM